MVKLFITAIVIVGILIGVWFHFMGFNLGSFGQIIGAQTGPQTATLQKPKVFEIGGNGDNPITVLATTLPQFALNLADGKYSNIWIAHAQDQQSMVKAHAINERGDANLKMTTQFDASDKQLVVTPVMENAFKPGMYQLSVTVKTVTGKDITVTQDFAWGVLAINTNKAIYQPGDSVNIGMTVLDDVGTTKCIAKNGVIVFGTAKVALTVTSPSGKVLNLSTDDGTIQGSPSCKDRSYSDDPDFIAKLDNLSAVGRYKLHMEATTVFGTRSIDSFFTVQATPPAFDIQRVMYPTRIYPRYKYPVTIDVTANKDYSGTVYDIVPSSFNISGVSGGGVVIKNGDYEKIQWQVNWQKGQLYPLSYTITFPPIAPEYYLIGPLTIGDFTEGNEWQVASDSIFSFVQWSSAFLSSGNSVTVTMGQGVATGDLLVMNCYKVTGTGSSTTFSSRSGTNSNVPPWSRAYGSGPSGERFAQFYTVVGPGTIPAGTTSIKCLNNGGTPGEFAADIGEYSGNATTAPLDVHTSSSTTHACNSTNDRTGALTPSSPDELLVTQFDSTTPNLTPGADTILGGSSIGFTNNNPNQPTTLGFNGTTNSYDSAWAEAVSASGVRDTVVWSGTNSGNSTCVNGMSAYNPTISVTQEDYWFLNNQDSLTPGTPLTGSQDTLLSLSIIGEAFRLRMILGVDATGTNQIGLQTLDMLLNFAPLPSSGLCSDVSNWTPVATTGAQIQTDIAWNQNPSLLNQSGTNITANTPNDPTNVNYTNVPESYYQDDFSGTNDPNSVGDVTNDQAAITDAHAGLWDFSLVDNTGGAGTGTYCLALIQANGVPLSAYKEYPEVSFAKAGVVIRGGSIIKGSGGGGAGVGGTKIL